MGVSIRQKPPGSGIWWVFVRHKDKRLSKKIGKKHKLALDVKRQLEEKFVRGALGLQNESPECPTFKEYAYGWETADGYRLGWLDTAKHSRKHSTRAGYELMVKNHLSPQFGSARLDQITSRQIHDFAISLLNSGRRSQTVKNVKNCLSAILQHACNPDGFIAVNPARGVRIPNPEHERPAREPDPCTWAEREAIETVFLEHYPDYYPLVVCGFRTGLRIGELLGLQIGDIDSAARLITVERSVTMGRVTTPKSKSSRRQVRMTSQLIQVLRQHCDHVKELALKGAIEVPSWLFVGPGLRPINYGNFVHRVWNLAMEKTGQRRRTPHDMRHTYATLRLSNGDTLAEVSKEMGHSTVSITYKTYYKWLPSESKSNIDDLDNPATNGTPVAPNKKTG